jgi:hypothetical protein
MIVFTYIFNETQLCWIKIIVRLLVCKNLVMTEGKTPLHFLLFSYPQPTSSSCAYNASYKWQQWLIHVHCQYVIHGNHPMLGVVHGSNLL